MKYNGIVLLLPAESIWFETWGCPVMPRIKKELTCTVYILGNLLSARYAV